MRSKPRRALRRRLLVAASTALLLAGLLAACSDGGEDSGDGDGVASLDESDDGDDGADEAETSQAGGLDDINPAEIEEVELEFAQCMREEGVDFPDPGGEIPQELYDDPNFESASQACQPILDEAIGDIELTPEMREEMQETMLAFAECMREEGVDYPDPQIDDSGMPGMEMPEDWDPTDPEVQRAFEACGEIMAGLGEAP